MSFVTKRERVFNEYKLYDLPARNEGKLKAYASCTDARAWSHFISDKTDHLFEIIKRNNEKCRAKYVPTEVIVDTLMVAKNAQISRLKQKIQEFERLLAAYGHLDLNAGQKSEIAKAHATIKAANKELDDLYIDLDLSGDAEVIDSEAFGTGKSRGDEISRSTVVETAKSSLSEWSYLKEPTPKKSRDEQSDYDQIDQDDQNIYQIDETKQIGHSQQTGDRDKFSSMRTKLCDTGTNAVEDSRIEELQDMIVTKDARLNAMQNTIAVLENDVCEPYCIYAHIYTALEKIFAILRQNLKYKQYLDLLTLGRNIQYIHIKGKILYKIKILEKFSIALIAPCSLTDKPQNCTCYRAEVLTGYENTYAVSATESSQTIIDKKREHLIADIIDVHEIKETLNNQGLPKSESESDSETEFFDIDECNTENKSRFLIKSLQLSYSELLNCYENLKSEKDILYVRCQELLKVEEENESLRNNIRSYNNLWNEMEYFRKRSENLDQLKAKYYLLLNETTNLESKYVAESEKNKVNLDTINELRNENLLLDKKLKESSLMHEKEINFLIFKMKEIECDNMCKEQQIKSLSSDIEKYVNEKYYVGNKDLQIFEVLDQIAIGNDQKHFEETCNCKNVAIEHLQQEINKNLEYMNELKLEAEIWEKKYDDAVNTIDTLNDKIRITNIRNQELNEKIVEKTNAIDNLHNILQNKLEQFEILNEELEKQESNNILLSMEINKTRRSFDSNFLLIDKENDNELKITNNYEKNNKLQNTNVYKYKDNESLTKNKQDILSHTEKTYPHSVEIIPDYTDNVEYKTLLNVPEREGVVEEKLLQDFKYINDDGMKYKKQNGSQEIENSKEIAPTHKYAEDISIEISKILNDLKNRVSLIEKEQQFFIKENSAEADTDFVFLSHHTHDLDDNQSSNSNCVHNDFLSQIKLLRQQSTATISKYDDIKEQYRKSLSLTKKENAELHNEILKSKDKNNADDTLHKMIQDKCKQNENLTELLKQKNYAIQQLLTEINKMRINFQEKIAILETEKHKLLNSEKESSYNTDFISKFSQNNDLLSNERQSSNINKDQKDVLSEFKLLREESSATIDKYDNVKEMYRNSLEIAKNESEDLKTQVTQINKVSKSLDELMSKYNKLLHEKSILQNELCEKTNELNNLKKNCQQVHCLVEELEPFRLKYELLCTETEYKLTNKEAEINELRQTNTLLERETTMTIKELKQKIHHLEQLCDNLKVAKEKTKTKLDEKKNELKDITQQLQCTKKENNDILSKINNLKKANDSSTNRIPLLENDISSMKSQLDFLNNVIIEKDGELLDLKIINEKFTNVQIYNDEMKKEINKLQQDLKTCKEYLKSLEDENKEVKMLNHNILSEMESIKTVLKIKEDEIIRTNLSFNDIKEEIEKIKGEKSCDSDRIYDLLNKLQLCEQIINKLKEDLTERNNNISELQNHINNLQEEIKKLHESLEIAVENSEKISLGEIEEIDQSTQKVKAHYTKATHNIKPEIGKLKDINESLKLLKVGAKETDTERKKCVSRINYLENERETVIHNLNQLEVAVLGICSLTNKSCTKDIIDVLHNIQKAYEDKNACYEEIIQNAQTSYQLLKNKAEEAQEITETERQKMTNEKENYEQNRLNMEIKIQHQNDQLHNKEIKHNDIIKDLETKLLNQQNLFDQINASNENHIKNLKNEVSSLMEIYEKSLTDIEALQQKLKVSEDYNILQNSQINKIYDDYQKNCTETIMLQNIKNKASSNNIELQTTFEIQQANQNIQTNDTDILSSTSHLKAVNSNMATIYENALIITKEENGSFIREGDTAKNKEIVANIFKPSVDIIKNKLDKLQTKTLEQYSIGTLMCDTDLNDFNLKMTNADVPLKSRDSVNIISRKKATDLSTINLVSHISDDKIEKELIIKIKCNDKQMQTVDDYHNLIVKTNEAVQLTRNPKPQNKFTDNYNSLPYKLPLENNLINYLREKEINILPTKPTSQTNSSAKDLMSKKKYDTNQYAAHKHSDESLDSAVKNITTEGSQNVQLYKEVSDCYSQDHLNLYSKAKSLDDLTKEEKFNHYAFQISQDELYRKNRFSIEKNNIISNINPYYKKTTTTKKLQNNVLSESKLISNTQDQTNNVSDTINYLPKYTSRRCFSYEQIFEPYCDISFEINKSIKVLSTNLSRPIKSTNKDTLEKLNTFKMYEKKIDNLTMALKESKNEHQKKIEAIKKQYENHIKSIINEHNKGVVSIQILHEETLSDVIKIHDIEIENLRALSIEAMTKTEKLERENKKLRLIMELRELKQRPAKLAEVQKRKSKSRESPSYLTKTDVEAFNVKPKRKSTVSCTCTMNINVSDTICNIFEQVGTKNKKMAEETYLKYIADKLMDGIEKLNPRELSFLHLKVCRIWKTIRNKDKTLKAETESLGKELVSLEPHPARRHDCESDKVIKNRRRCQDRKKATCKILPVKIAGGTSQDSSIPQYTKKSIATDPRAEIIIENIRI